MAEGLVDLIKPPQRKSEKKQMLNPIIREIIGEAHVIYGPPMAGKSTFAAYVCKQLYEALGKPGLYYAIDTNLVKTEWGRHLKEVSQAEWVEVRNPRALPWLLSSVDFSKYSAVVVDSLTGLFEAVVEVIGDPLDPRVNLALVRYASMITRRLAEIAHDYNILAILISHSGAIFGSDFYGERDKPAFSERALKNVDGVAKLYVKVLKSKQGEQELRLIKWLIHRNPRSTIRRREFRVEEIIGKVV